MAGSPGPSHLCPDKWPLSVKFLKVRVTGWGSQPRTQPSPQQNSFPPKSTRNHWGGTCQFSVIWSASKLRILLRKQMCVRPVGGSKQDSLHFQNPATRMGAMLGGSNGGWRLNLPGQQKQAVIGEKWWKVTSPGLIYFIIGSLYLLTPFTHFAHFKGIQVRTFMVQPKHKLIFYVLISIFKEDESSC